MRSPLKRKRPDKRTVALVAAAVAGTAAFLAHVRAQRNTAAATKTLLKNVVQTVLPGASKEHVDKAIAEVTAAAAAAAPAAPEQPSSSILSRITSTVFGEDDDAATTLTPPRRKSLGSSQHSSSRTIGFPPSQSRRPAAAAAAPPAAAAASPEEWDEWKDAMPDIDPRNGRLVGTLRGGTFTQHASHGLRFRHRSNVEQQRVAPESTNDVQKPRYPTPAGQAFHITAETGTPSLLAWALSAAASALAATVPESAQQTHTD